MNNSTSDYKLRKKCLWFENVQLLCKVNTFVMPFWKTDVISLPISYLTDGISTKALGGAIGKHFKPWWYSQPLPYMPLGVGAGDWSWQGGECCLDRKIKVQFLSSCKNLH